MYSQHHSFDISLATIYGIEGSILIQHFQHWIRVNTRKGQKKTTRKVMVDGKEVVRTFTYQTHKDIAAHFPYMTERQIKYQLQKLVDDKVLIRTTFNARRFDTTSWYAFVDEEKFGVDPKTVFSLYENQKIPKTDKIVYGGDKIVRPIPNTKTTDTEKNKYNTPPTPQREEPQSGQVWGKFVRLSVEEKKALEDRYGPTLVADMIDQINDHLSSTGKKPYRDYAATIRNWIRRRQTPGIFYQKPDPIAAHRGFSDDKTPRNPDRVIDCSDEEIF